MKLTLKDLLLTAGIVVLVVVLLTRESCNKSKLKEQNNLIVALNDKMQTGVNEDGQSWGSRVILMSQKVDDLLAINAGNDSTLITLQKEVQRLQKKLQGGDNVTVFYDSSHVHNTTQNYYLKGDSGTRISTHHDAWLDYTITSRPDSSVLDLSIKNGYSVALLHEKRKMFKGFNKRGDSTFTKKLMPVAVVTSFNPYSKIRDTRTYMVSGSKTLRFSLGVHGGVGMVATFAGQVYPGAYLGIGINYAIIHFGKTR